MTSGYSASAKQLRVDYELKYNGGSVASDSWFAPILSKINVVTEESIAHLSDEQKQALLNNIASLNSSIQQSNKVIEAFNNYQASGNATPKKFDTLTPLDGATLTVNV